jgi:hypothetical protein
VALTPCKKKNCRPSFLSLPLFPAGPAQLSPLSVFSSPSSPFHARSSQPSQPDLPTTARSTFPCPPSPPGAHLSSPPPAISPSSRRALRLTVGHPSPSPPSLCPPPSMLVMSPAIAPHLTPPLPPETAAAIMVAMMAGHHQRRPFPYRPLRSLPWPIKVAEPRRTSTPPPSRSLTHALPRARSHRCRSRAPPPPSIFFTAAVSRQQAAAGVSCGGGRCRQPFLPLSLAPSRRLDCSAEQLSRAPPWRAPLRLLHRRPEPLIDFAMLPETNRIPESRNPAPCIIVIVPGSSAITYRTHFRHNITVIHIIGSNTGLIIT